MNKGREGGKSITRDVVVLLTAPQVGYSPSGFGLIVVKAADQRRAKEYRNAVSETNNERLWSGGASDQ